MAVNGPVYTLTDITDSIARLVQQHYVRPYWITAEVMRLNYYPPSGHCFPELVDRRDSKIRSQVRGVIWRDDFEKISEKFEEVTRESITDGIKIMFLAQVKFSSEYGLSLQIVDIEPLYTLGELARLKMETIRKLKQEGVFTQNKSLSFPDLPKRIAVISASTSKGYNDLLVSLKNNAFGYVFHTELFQAALQGDAAIRTIAARLEEIGRRRDNFDVVAIIRGGGDEAGLSCYDDHTLASVVARFPIPVLTGIGHSTNETVVEMVAARNLITPTDVAHALISLFRDRDEALERSVRLLTQTTQRRLKDEQVQLDGLTGLLNKGTLARLGEFRSELNRRMDQFRKGTSGHLFANNYLLAKYETALQFEARSFQHAGRMRLADARVRLQLAGKNAIGKRMEHLQTAGITLNLLDPENVLKRGFTITRKNGRVVTDAAGLKTGDTLETIYYRGSSESRITEIKKNNG